VKGNMYRLVVLVAGVLGLLATTAGPASALISFNHCEPVRRLPEV
jgi:hypothetical protein